MTRKPINQTTVLAALSDEVEYTFDAALRGVRRYFEMFDADIAKDPERGERWIDSYYRVINGELDRSAFAILTVQNAASRLFGNGNPLEAVANHYRGVLRAMEIDNCTGKYLSERLPLKEAA